MTRRGFLFEEKWLDYPEASSRGLRIYGLPECFLRSIELPHFWKYYLGNLLHDFSAEQLHKIATAGLKLTTQAPKKEQLIYQIRETLVDPGEPPRVTLTRCPATSAKSFSCCSNAGASANTASWFRYCKPAARTLFPPRAVESLLTTSGLLFLETHNPVRQTKTCSAFHAIYTTSSATTLCPTNRCLRDLDALSRTQDFQPRAILDNGISILRDLVTFVSFTARHGLRRLTGGGIGKNDLKKSLVRLSAYKTLKYAQFLAYFAIWKKFLVPAGDSFAVSAEFEHPPARLPRTLSGHSDLLV